MPIVGDVLAERYRIDAPLGAGGMASVWRARDLRLERDVAVKLLAGNLAADPVVAQRFEREARSLAGSSHANVVAIYDVERGDPGAGREPFYVMELCDGGSLADRLTGSGTGRLTSAELVPIVAAIADGLGSLHERDLIHRDVKPHNILLCGGRAKLADFGLARMQGPTDLAELTATGMTVGTFAYLAPEVMDGRPATAESDVYGLGVVAFQGLTGRLPRPSGSVSEVVAARDLPAPRPSEVAPRLGPAFDDVLWAALSRDPAARPSAREFAAGLVSAAQSGPQVAATGTTPQADADAATQTIPLAGAVPPPEPGHRVSPPPSIQMREPSGTPPAWTRRERSARRDRWGPTLGALVLVGLAAIVLIALANGLADRGRPSSSETAIPATPSASASPSPSPSPLPSPSLSPTPPSTPSTPPPPTQDPLADVRVARDDLSETIDAVAGGRNGLKNRDAEELNALADDALTRLEQGDADGAQEQAGQLLDRVEGLSDEMDEDAAAALASAAEAFATAVDEATGGGDGD